jgi:hypothetical protein
MAIVPHTSFIPLADPLGPDPGTATQFQDLAGSDLALLDAADAALDPPRADALDGIAAGDAVIDALAGDLTAGADELDALLADVEADQKFDFLAEGDLWDSLFGSL